MGNLVKSFGIHCQAQGHMIIMHSPKSAADKLHIDTAHTSNQLCRISSITGSIYYKKTIKSFQTSCDACLSSLNELEHQISKHSIFLQNLASMKGIGAQTYSFGKIFFLPKGLKIRKLHF